MQLCCSRYSVALWLGTAGLPGILPENPPMSPCRHVHARPPNQLTQSLYARPEDVRLRAACSRRLYCRYATSSCHAVRILPQLWRRRHSSARSGRRRSEQQAALLWRRSKPRQLLLRTAWRTRRRSAPISSGSSAAASASQATRRWARSRTGAQHSGRTSLSAARRALVPRWPFAAFLRS